MNTSPLSDNEYINLIKTTITEVANDYQNKTEVDAMLLRDTMKMQTRSKSIQYARHKRGQKKLTETNLESVMMSLQKKLEENDLIELRFNIIKNLFFLFLFNGFCNDV